MYYFRIKVHKEQILLQNMLPLLLEYPEAFEILKLAQNIYTTKHKAVIKICTHIIYNVTNHLKLCQHFSTYYSASDTFKAFTT